MDQAQLTKLKTLGVPEVIKRYLPRLHAKEITYEQFQQVLRLVKGEKTPMPREEGSLVEVPPRSHEEVRIGTPEINPSPNQDRLPEKDVSPEDFIRAFTTHPTQASGTSQKERLLNLLKDGLFHTTNEIQREVYGRDHLGTARIASRVTDLRNDGYKIESKKVEKSVWAYRLSL